LSAASALKRETILSFGSSSSNVTRALSARPEVFPTGSETRHDLSASARRADDSSTRIELGGCEFEAVAATNGTAQRQTSRQCRRQSRLRLMWAPPILRV
jgi:hypothetical protein